MAAIQSTLVLGGARSGKSVFAERLVAQSGRNVVYVATATSSDDEMAERIKHHRARRNPAWTTIEEPLALVDTLSRDTGRDRAVVVDCLTLWLFNLMEEGRDPEVEGRRLARFLNVAASPIVMVSNEVGLGLVPETPLGREFRDAQGRLNQVIAAAVPNVVFIAAGLPLWLKCEPPE